MKRILAILIVSVFFVTSGFSESESVLGNNEGPLVIAWKAVAGAASYRVEIRRNGGIFIDTETAKLELKLDLSPGEYEYRVSVLDTFGNIGGVTDWQELTVQRAKIPYFRVSKPLTVWESRETRHLPIEIPEVKDNLSFVLERQNTQRPLILRETEEGTALEIDLRGLEPGEWDIRALADSGRTFLHPSALVIRPIRPPQVSGLDNTEFHAEGLVPVGITGIAFDSELEIAFKGPGGYIEVITVEVKGSDNAVAYLNLEGVEPGSYDLIASNPTGNKTVMANAITVIPPEKKEPLKVQPRWEFHLGWAPSMFFFFVQDSEMFAPILFETAVTLHSGWRKPFANGLGVEVRLLGGVSHTYNPVSKDFVTNGILKGDISGYWRPPVQGKAAPVILLGLGNTWSGYVEQQSGTKNIMHLRAGIGVDFSNYSNFTRLGLNADVGLTNNGQRLVLSLMFRRGYRL